MSAPWDFINEAAAERPALTAADTYHLVELIRDGILTLAVRDSLPVTRELADERARNIAVAILDQFIVSPDPEASK